LIIKFRKERPSLGYCYVVSYLNEHQSTEIPFATTVYAIWSKEGLLKKRYKKSEKKKDCRAIKQKYLAFEKIQIDVKELTLADTLFKQVVCCNSITRHKTIPPGAKTWQSEVETSHWIIEKELYDYVQAPNIGNLMKKFRAYQWGFNTLRKNGYRGNITPLESLRNEHNKNYAKFPKEIMDFASCIFDKKFNQFIKSGYHSWFSDQIMQYLSND